MKRHSGLAVFVLVLALAPLKTARAITVGPDAFGYVATNSTPYAFEEISATGTNLGLSDDSHFYGIPFNFSFYGTAYNQVAVGSNGTVYFENNYLGLVNTAIPDVNGYGVNRYIAVFWDDLNPGAGGAVYWQVLGAGVSERLVVEWKNVPHYNFGGAGTFQAVLYRQSGEIYAYYADTIFGNAAGDLGFEATAGIQSSASAGLQWSFNQAVLTNGLAIKYSLVPEPSSLLLLGIGAISLLGRRKAI